MRMPSTLESIQTQASTVLVLAFLLSAVLGWVLQRSHFCTMGALSDRVLMHDSTRLRQWALALSVGTLGWALMAAAGWIDPLQTIYAIPRFPWLSYLLGGFLFGIGMVLASGCPAKNLVRLAGGSLKALVVLLVMGITALASLRGQPGLWRHKHMDPITAGAPDGPFIGQWFASQTGVPVSTAMMLVALVVSSGLLVWVMRDRDFLKARHVLAGLAVGFVLLSAWAVTGIVGWVPEHPETLDAVFLTTGSGRMEGLSFTAPVAQWLDALMYSSEGSRRITFGMVLVPGVLAGAALAARQGDGFRWEGFTQTADLARHLVGAVLMGMGGVAAMGCSFGQGMTGLSTLNWGSLVAVGAMAGGATMAIRFQLWLSQRED